MVRSERKTVTATIIIHQKVKEVNMNQDLQFVRKWNLQPGDTVVIPKSLFDLVQHHALYLGSDEYGNHYMCENVIGIGVKLTGVREFFASAKRVTRIERFSGTNYDRKIVVQ